MMRAGQPPRILTSEDQEKLRNVCRVSQQHTGSQRQNVVSKGADQLRSTDGSRSSRPRRIACQAWGNDR